MNNDSYLIKSTPYFRSLRADSETYRADTQRLQQENRSVNNIPYGLLSYLEPTLLQIPGRDS